ALTGTDPGTGGATGQWAALVAADHGRSGRDPDPETPRGRSSMPIRYLPDPVMSRNARRTASNASSMTPGWLSGIGTPPPCATSGFPPPLPPRARAAMPTSVPADRPKPRPASLTAMTTTGLSAGTPTTMTTPGGPPGTPPRTATAR